MGYKIHRQKPQATTFYLIFRLTHYYAVKPTIPQCSWREMNWNISKAFSYLMLFNLNALSALCTGRIHWLFSLSLLILSHYNWLFFCSKHCYILPNACVFSDWLVSFLYLIAKVLIFLIEHVVNVSSKFSLLTKSLTNTNNLLIATFMEQFTISAKNSAGWSAYIIPFNHSNVLLY